MIRLGVIGHGGRISGVVRWCLRKADPSVRIVGIVDPDEEGARMRLDDCDKTDCRFYATLQDMVKREKLDALCIGTRCHQHTPYAIQAAKYDLPLYLEKPVSINMEQAQALEKAFAKSKCEVVVSFPLRVSPLCTHTREQIAAGAIGEPVHILAVNYVPYGAVYWEEPYRDYAITQGLFLQKATHDLDYMSYLVDSPIVRVSAMAVWGKVFGGSKKSGLVCSRCSEQATCLESPQNRKRNRSWHTNDHPCVFSVDCGSRQTGTNEDCSSCLVEFASGAQGVYTQVFYPRRDAASRGATVSGYMGTLSFDWYTNSMKYVRHHAPFTDTTKAAEGMSHFGGDDELATDFISLIQGKIKRSRTPIETGLRSVYSCLACKESAATGKFVKVRQLA